MGEVREEERAAHRATLKAAVDDLVPVLRHNGLEAVSEAWAKSEKRNGQPTATTLKAAVDDLANGKPKQKQAQGEVLSSTNHAVTTPSAVGQLENAVALAKKHLTRGLVKKAFEESPEDARRLAEEGASWAATVTKAAKQRVDTPGAGFPNLGNRPRRVARGAAPRSRAGEDGVGADAAPDDALSGDGWSARGIRTAGVSCRSGRSSGRPTAARGSCRWRSRRSGAPCRSGWGTARSSGR